ncbi:MAG: hypothetical protein IKD21_03375 [Clostridia bacterium]|nr:hypothetical protein [Clostridia bacterium]
MMTREKKEQLSNRLVLNFGVLLIAAVILLYVNTALRNASSRDLTYLIVLIVGIVSAVFAAFLFIWGKMNKPGIKNYSAIGLGTFIGCALIYASKVVPVPAYDHVMAVITVYVAMAVYFIVMAIITAVMLRKPLVKSESQKIVHAKKRK